jgi:hypothetical protein
VLLLVRSQTAAQPCRGELQVPAEQPRCWSEGVPWVAAAERLDDAAADPGICQTERMLVVPGGTRG